MNNPISPSNVPATLTGRIIRPNDPGWDGARHGFAARYDYNAQEPITVVFCQNENDVRNAILWAREHELPLRVRSGRHSYQAYSSLVKGGIIIDVSEMETVDFNPDTGIVKVGAGIDMLQFTELLAESAAALPLATGSSVGLAGLTLGGGFGIISRKYGLTCDNLVGLRIVTATGELLEASESENSDLFWACRGGGGNNFGIVTQFAFQTHQVGLVTAFNIEFPWDNFEAVVDTWQKWAPTTDDGVTSLLSITVEPKLTLLGQFTAPPEELGRINELLAPMLALGPYSVQIQTVPYVVAARMFFGVDPINPTWAVRQHGDQQIFKSTSALAYELFSLEDIQQLKTYLDNVPPLSAPPSQPSMVQLLGGGGYPSRVPTDATAVYHRKSHFVVQYDGYWTAPQDGEATIQWVEAMRNHYLPCAHGAYVNYVDDLIQNPLRAYYASNLERLVEIKAKYDPENIFNFPQSIPTSLPTSLDQCGEKEVAK